ncbi:MAG: helix-turn-helix domain-containing protein [Bifidobacteriaceae bacterium]|jgi:excisionase family DNA binding protein|nr:helix-turn-helix domain-containing protein [Bifidobacteriaceae bacterium]
MNQDRPPSRPRFLTVAEVADQMRVSGMTVYRLIHAGELRAIRVGRSFRVPADALDEYLAAAEQAGPAAIADGLA